MEFEMSTKTKSKSIIIDGDIHANFKSFCKSKSLKIGGVIEDLIKVYLTDPKKINKLIEESKDL